jgi:hypothetical protein
MKHCHHSVPATRISQPHRPARAWLGILLAVGSFPLHAAPVAITGAGNYSQNFDTLSASGSATWADDTTVPGWYSQRSGSSGNSIIADPGSETAGNLYSYGSTAERALGSIGSGTAMAGNFAHGVQLQNTSGEAATVNSLAYTGEQWRKGGETVAQVVTLWYQISPTPITSLAPSADTGWTAVPAGNFSSPVNTDTGTSLNGNDLANRTTISINPNIFVPAGNYLMIRWKDPDHTGVDHGLAIDDVSLAWITSPVISLSPGAIAFVGFNADGNDDLAFVALAIISPNAVIRFTDKGWNGSPVGAGGAFPAGEGVITWTSPVGGVAAGEVISLNNLETPSPLASIGSVARSGSFQLSGENETVYAYQGAELTPTGFLAMIATHDGDSPTGTGLSPAHIIRLPDDEDVAAYTGSRADQTSFAAYLTLLGVAGNWLTQDADGDQSTDGTAPDVPFASTAFTVTGAENTFASWLIANAPGESAAQDRDHDGLPNGVEYFMGTAGNAFTAHPGIVSGAVSWARAAGTTIAAFKVEVSTSLDTWEDANINYAANLNIGTSEVVFTMPSGPQKLFVRLNVTP